MSRRETERAGARGAGMQPPAALTVGSFDGLHVGHQAVLAALVRRAARAGLPAVLVTFEPHPLDVLRPGGGPPLLTERAERTALLAGLGLDRVVLLRFSPELAALQPRAFVRDLLVRQLGCRELVVGEDHRFGRGRAGGIPELAELAGELALGLEIVPRVQVEGAPASSTRARQAVAQGDLGLARSLLGRPYGVFASVVRGEGRGAALGFPTANLAPGARKQMPPEGIYACRARVGRRTLAAAVHWGGRPTFQDARPVLEAHLLGHEGDLYGRWVELAFLERLRGVERFSGTDALARAMSDDVRRVSEIAAAQGGVALHSSEQW